MGAHQLGFSLMSRGRQITFPVLGHVTMSMPFMPFLALGGSFLLSSDAKGSKNELGAAAEETFKFPNTSITHKEILFPKNQKRGGSDGFGREGLKHPRSALSFESRLLQDLS